MSTKIGFIGCGRMAQALILGLIETKVFHPSEIGATDVATAPLEQFARQTGISVVPNNQDLIENHSQLLLAIKPQNYAAFAEENKKFFTPEKLLISIVTGISLARLSELTPRSVRVMPNTPALVGAGAAGFCVTSSVSTEQIAFTRKIFQSVGIAEQVEESMMDAVTGLSGSGPAYIYLIVEALANAAVKEGLPAELASRLATQTVKGAALMLEKTGETPSKLRDQVTSPGGTTLEGLKVMEAKAIRDLLQETVSAAANRSRELGR